MQTTRQAISYNTERMRADLAEKGWLQTDLARVARVSDMTVTRFFRGEQQNARMAKKLAEALGFTLRRYLVRGEAIAS